MHAPLEASAAGARMLSMVKYQHKAAAAKNSRAEHMNEPCLCDSPME
jgi:hypothetical protein